MLLFSTCDSQYGPKRNFIHFSIYYKRVGPYSPFIIHDCQNLYVFNNVSASERVRVVNNIFAFVENPNPPNFLMHSFYFYDNHAQCNGVQVCINVRIHFERLPAWVP